MSNLTLASIIGEPIVVAIADDTLVYNGFRFVDPSEAKFVELYGIPTQALSLAFGSVLEAVLIAETINLARVLSYDSTSEPTTDTNVVTAPDPAGGLCICLVTCKGTALTYVRVYNQEE